MAKKNAKKKSATKKLTPQEQRDRFVAAAKIADADESLGAMEKAFIRLNPRRKPKDDRPD